MVDRVWLILALPAGAAIALGALGRRLSRAPAATLGVAPAFVAAALTIAELAALADAPVAAKDRTVLLGSWVNAGALHARAALHLDPLSLLMAALVTGVGALILLYAAEQMSGERDLARFFAQMNLFLSAMLVLVLADDLLLLYLGWEGVGLCSYLLIGFWYHNPQNGRAARKAFVVTRVGDAAMALGLFLILRDLHTLRITDVLAAAPLIWHTGHPTAALAAALLLCGALGKSAQLPLHTWLPDAMAGPTPASALIHAATMVTAGVYLVVRLAPLFRLAPQVMHAAAALGATTMVIAGFAALAQRDIKRVLAYSTMSQIGFMFIALGVGALFAAMFHLLIHAFFKALLFLCAGAVIRALHHEHDLFRMGGLRRSMPLTFAATLAGSAALSGLPLVTAGFYSKDLVLWRAFVAPGFGPLLFAAGAFGALLTSLYAFRLVFLVFFGAQRTAPAPGTRPGVLMALPMVVLAALSLCAGFVELPATLGHVTLLSDFLAPALPVAAQQSHTGNVALEAGLQTATGALSLFGVWLAAQAWVRRRSARTPHETPLAGPRVHHLLADGFGFDALFDLTLARPYSSLASVNRADILDRLPAALAALTVGAGRALCATQAGKLRHYVAGIGLGALLLLTLAVLS